MTIKDIARLSGYSLGTVSRVLNHHPDVSEQARKKVMAVVEEHGRILARGDALERLMAATPPAVG